VVYFNRIFAKKANSGFERHSAVIPLHPPLLYAGDDFGKIKNIIVYFLACNQLYIIIEEDRNIPMHYQLFAKNEKLCTPCPIVKTWQITGVTKLK